jgi:diaminohydroxyphosphoribosylaminopyrimidine deaminase/5-amino-6-(5-phosphoribosylamino)uracil reductase
MLEIRKIPLDESYWRYKEPKPFEEITPTAAMELACQVALKGAGAVHTNPLVGAVLVDERHRFLAAAAHLAYGQEHAEINLIDQVHKKGLETKLAQCILYTTLEPCSHVGKTQPCVNALVKIPLEEVVYGTVDPNPLVAGRGIAFLENSSIRCTHSPEFGKMGRHLLEQFKWCLRKKTPFVGLKAALTLNGMAAYQGDQRAWITLERARNYAHWLRLSYEAVLVGANTVICDNPTLNIRHPNISGRTPLRVVLDPQGQALLSRPLLEHKLVAMEPTKTLWICDEAFWRSDAGASAGKALQKYGTQFYSLDKEWSMNSLLEMLGEKNIASLMLEGGPGIWGSFLNEGLVNKVHLFLAPKFFSGKAINFGSSLSSDRNLSFEEATLTILDNDILIEGPIP